MDHPHITGDMSPLYVPRKRKSVQSQPKSCVPCPVVQRLPERACKYNVVGYIKNDESQAQDALKMKRSSSRKRYDDLQSVAMGTADYPTTSCSVMLTNSLVNGMDLVSVAPPTSRLMPRLSGKDVWPQAPEASRERGPDAWATGRERPERPQEQTWHSSRERGGHSSQDQAWTPSRDRAHRGAEQAWGTGQEKGPEQAWGAGRSRAQDQAWNAGRDGAKERTSSGPEQTWSGRSPDHEQPSTSKDRGHVWRPELNMKKVQRAETERPPAVTSFEQPPEGRNTYTGSVSGPQNIPQPSTSQTGEKQKTVVVATKKEPPVYPAGSQEERWQLQIVAKGRVPCPKCKSVSRKTVEGLKKHMENCRQQPYTCQHCGKQLKSSTGMKYHIMADHGHVPSPEESKHLDDRAIKDKLRKILKRLGRLKCSKEGCSAAFTSIMGYVYHMKKCGKEESELEKLLLNCSHCGKAYKSKAGLEYHLRSEHMPTPQQTAEEEALRAESEANLDKTASGRILRASAQVANYHLAEIANNELPKEWPKKKFQSDLVPDDKKLKYARPGLPAFSQEVLRKWKNEVKLHRKVYCPNQGCGCTYTSVSGLKAHLGLCTKGDFEAGKYRCLICSKEFNSESGVKYHINSVHSQEWFVTNKKASKKFEKFLKTQSKSCVHTVDRQIIEQYHQHHLHHHHHTHHQHQYHHHHHHVQQPLQPLHHLQHQPHVLHQDHQNFSPQGAPQHQQSHLHYTAAEPPVWVDMDRGVTVPGPESAPIEMDVDEIDKPQEAMSGATEVNRREKGGRRGEKGKADGKVKDCFVFIRGGSGGHGVNSVNINNNNNSSSSSSSSNTGSSSSESDLEAQERQRQIEQWNLKRPGIMEAQLEVVKRHRNT